MADNMCWTEWYQVFSDFDLLLISDECSLVRVVPVGMYSNYSLSRRVSLSGFAGLEVA